MLNRNNVLIIGFILLGILTRIIPHPPNFTALGAIALFGGAFLNEKKIGLLIPLGALFISDLFIGFHGLMWAVYLSFAMIVFIGSKIKKPSFLNVIGASIIGSLLFFIITNFAVWTQGLYYTMDLSGLLTSYEMAIPFFRNTLLGDLVFTTSLFSLFYLIQQRFPVLDKNYISK